jgi:hypothetical protein
LEHLVDPLKEHPTPASPRSIITRAQKGDILLSPTQQTKSGSGVGMLLYLVKHSFLDISNAVPELSKVSHAANLAHSSPINF